MNYLLFGDGENFSKFGIRRPETKALEKNSLDDLRNQIWTKVNVSLRIISIVYESNFVLFRLFSYNTFCNRSTPFHIVLFRIFIFLQNNKEANEIFFGKCRVFIIIFCKQLQSFSEESLFHKFTQLD